MATDGAQMPASLGLIHAGLVGMASRALPAQSAWLALKEPWNVVILRTGIFLLFDDPYRYVDVPAMSTAGSD